MALQVFDANSMCHYSSALVSARVNTKTLQHKSARCSKYWYSLAWRNRGEPSHRNRGLLTSLQTHISRGCWMGPCAFGNKSRSLSVKARLRFPAAKASAAGISADLPMRSSTRSAGVGRPGFRDMLTPWFYPGKNLGGDQHRPDP